MDQRLSETYDGGARLVAEYSTEELEHSVFHGEDEMIHCGISGTIYSGFLMLFGDGEAQKLAPPDPYQQLEAEQKVNNDFGKKASKTTAEKVARAKEYLEEASNFLYAITLR